MDSLTHPDSKQPSWLRKNWKMVTLILVGTGTLFCAFIAAIFMIVFGSMKQSGAYQLALSRANATPAVVTQIGQPLKGGWFITGNIHTSGPSGHAELAIPLSGTRGKGTLYTIADKQLGEWKTCSLVFMPDSSGTKVVIVDSATTQCPVHASED